MSVLDKFAPKSTGIRDPRDAKKKNGMFWNWPRFLFIGGAPQGHSLNQSGEKAIMTKPQGGQSAVQPINDRGRGR